MILRKLPVLVLHVNNRCNCRCVMCSIWKSTDESELTPQTLRRLLPEISTLGVESVVMTGGEPLMKQARGQHGHADAGFLENRAHFGELDIQCGSKPASVPPSDIWRKESVLDSAG